MELDELRRRWQEPVKTDFLPANLNAMQAIIARSSASPIAKMRRNAWLELVLNLALILLCVGVMLRISNVHAIVMSAWIAVLSLGGLLGFRQQLRLLQPLSERSHSLRQQLEQQVSGLQKFMAHAHTSAVRTVPISFGIGLVLYTVQEWHTYHGWLLVAMLGFLWGLYAAVIWAAYRFMPLVFREFQQQLYGQHLDRLAAALRELQEIQQPQT